MFSEFNLHQTNSPPPTQRTPDEEKLFGEACSRMIRSEERDRLELLLLQRLKERKPELEQMLQEMSGHWNYEDHFYRYYHGSFKVYGTQKTTEKAVRLLRDLLPERKLNLAFDRIIREGTGQQFEMEHNQEWDRRTRPMLEAFSHARFMIEMGVRYAGLRESPRPMPSGYAALLYLFDLR